MAIKGISVAYCVTGGLILYAGIKGATMSDTAKAVLTGDLTLKNTQAITIKNSADKQSTGSDGVSIGSSPSGSGAVMLKFCLAQRGKPYSQAARYGPNSYDCSGLIAMAAKKAGVGIPGGPGAENSDAIVDPELQNFCKVGGKAYTNVHDIKAGDILGFYSSDANVHGNAKMNPDGNTMNVGGINVKSCGHIGIAVNPMQYMSAYDTAEGCLVKPIAGDSFVVGVRLP